nr:insulin-like peptide 1 [Hyphantria cunea]
MKFLPTLLLFFVFTCVSCDNSHVYCGRRLSNILAAVCWDDEPMKRDAGWGFSPIHMRALGGYRGKRGPVDECCYKPCTIDELRGYC